MRCYHLSSLETTTAEVNNWMWSLIIHAYYWSMHVYKIMYACGWKEYDNTTALQCIHFIVYTTHFPQTAFVHALNYRQSIIMLLTFIILLALWPPVLPRHWPTSPAPESSVMTALVMRKAVPMDTTVTPTHIPATAAGPTHAKAVVGVSSERASARMTRTTAVAASYKPSSGYILSRFRPVACVC